LSLVFCILSFVLCSLYFVLCLCLLSFHRFVYCVSCFFTIYIVACPLFLYSLISSCIIVSCLL
jgi:hypothetical protein